MDQIPRQQLIEALVQAALLESREISVRMAEIIGYLQRREHLPALGAFETLDESFKLIGVTLSAAARLTR